jgi:hypothetical protein
VQAARLCAAAQDLLVVDGPSGQRGAAGSPPQAAARWQVGGVDVIKITSWGRSASLTTSADANTGWSGSRDTLVSPARRGRSLGKYIFG